ncbi:hypothetical protein PR003_g29280 [Phytophthora rubi]|uniref:Uncharacterized protein n=1 Tax=Phytophthora rubi TaxID=129364 RepID=A0A6A4BSY6_9STRA|nr:hypothetical protein PR003_g29280 [Phytophthora rubi]
MRDGYGGLEALFFVETLSDEDIRDLSEMVNPRLSIRPVLLLPRSADSAATVPEFRDLLSSMDAKQANLVHHRAAKRQLRSSGSRDVAELLEKHSEISAMKTGFDLPNQHWKYAFLVCKRQLDQEISDHARDFKRAVQSHEQKEDVLRSRLASMTQERDDMFAFARSLKRQLKAGSRNVPRVMNFLNQHQTQVVGNTPRLKGLLEHLKDHQFPPNVWTTQITVTAIDDYSAQPGPFGTLNEEDADEEKKEDSEPPAKLHRPAQDRRRSVLARKEYSELAPDELALVETPGRGTTGFPDYTPNLSKTTELEVVRVRWNPPSFKVLWDSAPWDDMFQQRLKFLNLHSAHDLSVRAKSDLVNIVEFMWTHRRTFWLIGHSFFIDHHRDHYSANLHADHKKQ